MYQLCIEYNVLYHEKYAQRYRVIILFKTISRIGRSFVKRIFVSITFDNNFRNSKISYVLFNYNMYIFFHSNYFSNTFKYILNWRIFFKVNFCFFNASTSNLSIVIIDTNWFYSALLFNIPEFNSLTSVDMALVTLSAATSKSFLKDRPKLLLALLEPLPGKLFVLNADLTSKISIFLARSNFQIKVV